MSEANLFNFDQPEVKSPWTPAGLLGKIPAPTHRFDPDTSKAAAKVSTVKRGSEHERILRALADLGPQTADELAHKALVRGDYDSRRRVSLLKSQGYVEDSGQRRFSERGNAMMVVAITAKGRGVLNDSGVK